MGRIFGFVALLLVLGIGLYLYKDNVASITPGGQAPGTLIDVTAVRNDLIAMANAEKRYWATHSKYAALDELRTNGDISVPTRPTYVYSVEAGENNFTIVATYTGTDPKAPKHLSVDDAMSMKAY